MTYPVLSQPYHPDSFYYDAETTHAETIQNVHTSDQTGSQISLTCQLGDMCTVQAKPLTSHNAFECCVKVEKTSPQVDCLQPINVTLSISNLCLNKIGAEPSTQPTQSTQPINLLQHPTHLPVTRCVSTSSFESECESTQTTNKKPVRPVCCYVSEEEASEDDVFADIQSSIPFINFGLSSTRPLLTRPSADNGCWPSLLLTHIKARKLRCTLIKSSSLTNRLHPTAQNTARALRRLQHKFGILVVTMAITRLGLEIHDIFHQGIKPQVLAQIHSLCFVASRCLKNLVYQHAHNELQRVHELLLQSNIPLDLSVQESDDIIPPFRLSSILCDLEVQENGVKHQFNSDMTRSWIRVAHQVYHNKDVYARLAHLEKQIHSELLCLAYALHILYPHVRIPYQLISPPSLEKTIDRYAMSSREQETMLTNFSLKSLYSFHGL